MAAEGHDVYMGGVPAYSTLGYFDDPILSTFIRYPDAELARLLFHELAHQQVYARDDTTFNESFAVAVEEEGVRRWLRAQGRDADLAAFRAMQVRKRELASRVEAIRRNLENVYKRNISQEEKRKAKAEEFAKLRAEYGAIIPADTRRPSSAYGSARKRMRSTALNTALVAPMPRAAPRIAVREKAGFRVSPRIA